MANEAQVRSEPIIVASFATVPCFCEAIHHEPRQPISNLSTFRRRPFQVFSGYEGRALEQQQLEAMAVAGGRDGPRVRLHVGFLRHALLLFFVLYSAVRFQPRCQQGIPGGGARWLRWATIGANS